jgi:hypothetical protein
MLSHFYKGFIDEGKAAFIYPTVVNRGFIVERKG